jgi:HEAT repeat protein
MSRSWILLLLLLAGSAAFFALRPGSFDPASASIDELIEALQQPDEQQRAAAVLELGRRGTPAIKPLETLLRLDVGKGPGKRSPDVHADDPRGLAIDALVLMGEPAVPALIDALAIPEHLERSLAAIALTQIEIDPRFVPRLIELMSSENGMIAGTAAHFLMGINPAGPQAMEALLASEGADTRRLVTRAIRALGSAEPGGTDRIVQYLEHGRAEVRRAFLEVISLETLRPDQARAIVPLLSDPDLGVRTWASTVLRPLAGALRPWLEEVLRSGNEAGRIAAAGLLGNAGVAADSTNGLLQALLEEPSLPLRAAAALALQRTGHPPADLLVPLLDALRHGPLELRRQAAAALGATGEVGAQATKTLIEAVNAEDQELARFAIQSLGRLLPHDDTIRPTLEKLALDDEQRPVLAKAAQEALAPHAGESERDD